MKIAILGTRGIPARYGGFETFAEQLGTRLAERGHDVTVFCEGTDEARSVYRGVNLEYVPVPELGPLRTIVFDARCLWRSRCGFDFVYMLGYGAAPFCVIPRLWGTQVWINMDGMEWRRAKWSWPAKLYLRMGEAFATVTASGLIADADAIRAYLTSTYPYLRRCTVIPYGAPVVERPPDRSLLNTLGLEPEAYHLVVCRLEPENHVKEIIEGFRASNSVRPLVLVGDHTVDNDYIRLLRSMAGSRVRFLGAIYDATMLQALRYHSLAYFHGHSVGGTNPSLLEAMGCANAVVAHDNPFNREVLGASALFFSDPAQLAAHVEWIETHRAERARLKSEVVQRLQGRYTWEAVTEKYCQLFSLQADIPSFHCVIKDDHRTSTREA